MFEPRSDLESDDSNDEAALDEDNNAMNSVSSEQQVETSSEHSSSENKDLPAEEETSVWQNLAKPKMTLEELIKTRDRVGIKNVKAIVENSMTKRKRNEQKLKRENKNRPQEISSKRKVSCFREVIHVPKKRQGRDPRFDNLCGSEYSEEVFEKRYSFLSEIHEREKNDLQRQLHKTKNDSQRARLKYLLNRAKQQSSSKQKRREEREVEKEWKKEEKKKVAQGKKPYFMKKAEKKQMLASLRDEKLRAKGNLDKMDAKRDKKKKGKEMKKFPNARRTYMHQ